MLLRSVKCTLSVSSLRKTVFNKRHMGQWTLTSGDPGWVLASCFYWTAFIPLCVSLVQHNRPRKSRQGCKQAGSNSLLLLQGTVYKGVAFALSLSPQMKATHHIHACKRGSGVGLSPVPCFLVLEAAYLWSFPLKSTAVEVAGKCAEFLVFLLRPPFYVRFSSWNSRFPWACLASRVILVTHKKTQLAGFDSWYFRGHHFPKMAASLCVGRRQFEEWIGRNDLHHSSFIWNTQECGLCAG